MKKMMLFIVLFIITIWSATAVPLSLKGVDGSVYFEGEYLTDSQNMPGLFYNDAGSTKKFEVLNINPSQTIYSDKYVKYSDDFDTDKWSSDSYSSDNISRSVNGVVSGESVIYPTVADIQASVTYNIDFINAIEKVTLNITGTRRDTEHNLTIWASQDNITYTKVIEFENTARTTKQANITGYLKDNQTWIELRFLKSSLGDNSPRILDFSIEVIYESNTTSPAVNASVKNTSYIDDFDTDKWTTDKQSSYGVNRSVNDVVTNETVLYPTIADNETYVRYSFNLSGKESALLTTTGTRRDTEHNLTIWASQDNITYTKITEFENTARTTKQTDISNFINNNLTWLEFRFYDNSSGDNTPRILDFSINTTTHQWRSLNVTTGGNIEIPTRTIDSDHFYYFAPHYPSSAGVINARVAYLGNKYPAIDINSQRAVLGSFIKNDADFVLNYGTPLPLGSGFVLDIEDMGNTENMAVVTLKKNGKLLDRGIFEAGKTYSFKTEVEGVKDVEILKADVISVFRSDFYNRVELKNVYLLDTTATIIKQGESFGDFEVDLKDFDGDGDTDITIKQKKDKTFKLDKNRTIDLFGGLSIQVANSNDLRFAVIKKYVKSGTYQQTGSYGSYGQSYNIDSFDAPGLFTYNMDKNDTFESLSISSSTKIINNINYSSYNKNNRIAYLGKTYQASFSGENMVLNEVLKEDTEKFLLKYGSPLYIEGFILELLDIGERTALLQLKKGNIVLEKKTVESGNYFVYEKSIEQTNVEILNVTVNSVFRSDFAALVELDDMLLLDDNTVILKDGDSIGGDYEVDILDIDGNGDTDIMVKLKSGKSFSVNNDSTTEILGGYMNLKAYENSFLPVRSVIVNIDPINPIVTASATSTPIKTTSQTKDPTPIQTPNKESTDMVVETEEQTEIPPSDSREKTETKSPLSYVLGGISSLYLLSYGWFRYVR